MSIKITTNKKIYQSDDGLILVADEWLRNFCPPNLVKDGADGAKNAELVLGRCIQVHGMLTISGLNEACQELAAAGQLSLAALPTEPTQAELEAIADKKSEERMHRDYLESKKTGTVESVQTINAKNAEIAKKAALAKELASVNAEIASAINSFLVGNPNRGVSYSATQAGQDAMKEARGRHNRSTIAGARAALADVLKVRSRL